MFNKAYTEHSCFIFMTHLIKVLNAQLCYEYYLIPSDYLFKSSSTLKIIRYMRNGRKWHKVS